MFTFLLHWFLTVCTFFVFSCIVYTFFQYKYYALDKRFYENWAVFGRKSPDLGSWVHWSQFLPFRNKVTDDPPYLTIYSLHTLCVVGFQYTLTIHIYWEKRTEFIPMIGNLLIFMLLMHITQYFEHLMMHKFLYKYHKPHHHFKNPEPWDGYYVHPVETYINMIIFFLPCLLMYDYLGLTEILIAHSIFIIESGIAHTGVRIGNTYLDQMTEHHELHHIDSNCNYGTLGILCDWMFGTLAKKHCLKH